VSFDLAFRQAQVWFSAPYNPDQNEKGPSPFEPGPSSHVVIDYFLIFAFRARAADP
jgi:hypothetical protein